MPPPPVRGDVWSVNPPPDLSLPEAADRPEPVAPAAEPEAEPAERAAAVAPVAARQAGDATTQRFWTRRVLLPVWLWILIGMVAAAVIVLLVGDDEAAAPSDPPAPPTSVPASTALPPEVEVDATSTAPAVAPSSAAASTAPAPTTTVPPTTITASTTAAPTTTSAPTTSAAPTTTVAPTTTAAPAVTTTTVARVPGAPAVIAVGAEGPCRFGPDCLIAGFSIQDFDDQPTRFVCEFQDGSRFEYRFDGDGVMYACATNAADATITIEVAGVRSNTLTRA